MCSDQIDEYLSGLQKLRPISVCSFLLEEDLRVPSYSLAGVAAKGIKNEKRTCVLRNKRLSFVNITASRSYKE